MEEEVMSRAVAVDSDQNHQFGRFGNTVKVKCAGPFECQFCGIYNWTNEHERMILGKILTIIDAAVSSPTQNQSLKDLIRQVVYPATQDLQDNLGSMFARK